MQPSPTSTQIPTSLHSAFAVHQVASGHNSSKILRFKALLSTHFNFHVDDVFCALAFLVLKIIISEALWYHTSLDSHSWPYQGPYLHWQLLKL